MKQSRKLVPNNVDFVASEQKAKSRGMKKSLKTENFAELKNSEKSEKSEIVEKIVRLARKERLKIISVGIAFSGEIDRIRFRNSFSIKAYNACAGC